MARKKNKRKIEELTPSEPTLPTRFMGLESLGRSVAFTNNDLAEKHLQYYRYEERTINALAEDYLFPEKHGLLRFLPTLIELQKSRMNPVLFGNLEGIYYQWKYEHVLRQTHVWKSDHGRSNNGNDCNSESNSNSKNDDSMMQVTKAKSAPKDDSRSPPKEASKADNKTDNETADNKTDNKTTEVSNKTDNKTTEVSKEYIRGIKFGKNVLNLKNSKISLELKEGGKEGTFVPWIYLKTVEVKGKKTIGMFAGRNFPSKTGIGFYISYPWLKWPEAFTDTPPEDYDAELQRQELLPTEEAGDYMWFMDNAGFMTACDPVHKPRQEKDKANDVTVGKRILGMGFHLVKELDKANIEVDDNGCIRTICKIKVDTQLQI